jgi:hypothetical protein
MSPELFQVMAVVFTVWGAAVAFKAINALRSGEAYVFGMWDGGMLRAGKRLNKMGMQIKVVVGAAMSIACLGLVTGAIPMETGCYVVMFIGVLSIVSDFVNGD